MAGNLSESNPQVALRYRFHFPWLSVLLAIAAALLYYGAGHPKLAGHPLMQSIVESHGSEGLLVAFFLALTFDLVRRHQLQRLFNERLKKYDQHVRELIEVKNSLQQKAHQYNEHANKLKLFISERLLEYLEYDEKYLHFKHIASEVRHNGVIAFDKVNQALKDAQPLLDEKQLPATDEAMHSMRYLWDLLDLATTDNIAMYIANNLYKAEEHLFQMQLTDGEYQAPYTLTFALPHAIKLALRRSNDSLPPDLPETGHHCISMENDRILWLDIDQQCEILGNENHLILLLENLINNALYYLTSGKYANKYPRLAIELATLQGKALIKIFNNGPTISSEDARQIFQLGFTTKRSRGHHGKGLGLYFVNEIVKGYDGKIRFKSLHNKEETYHLRIESNKGEIINEIIDIRLDKNSMPLCRIRGQDEDTKACEFKITGELESIEVIRESNKHNSRFLDTPREESRLFDQNNPALPRWCMEIKPFKKHIKLYFQPLSVQGVQFLVEIPTVEARLDPDAIEVNKEAEKELEALGRQFEEISRMLK